MTAVEFYAEGLENLQYNPLEKNGYDNAKQRLLEKAMAMSEDENHKAYLKGHEVGFMKAKEMEEKQMIDFALFRDDYLEKAEKLEDFTIPNEKLIKLFKHELNKSE